MKFRWKLKRYGIECVTVGNGVIDADNLQEAQAILDKLFTWGTWEQGEIQLDDRNKLCLDAPVTCYIKEITIDKPYELVMWRWT